MLTALSARPVESIDPPLRDALRIGLYQLVYLGSVPDHAAVEQTVELAKLERGGGHRYANAVMRRASREAAAWWRSSRRTRRPTPPFSTRTRSGSRACGGTRSGRDEALALLERDNEPPESAIRANELIVTREELRDVLASSRSSRARCRAARGAGARHAVRRAWLAAVRGGRADAAVARLDARGPHARPPARRGRARSLRGARRQDTHLAALMRGRGQLVAVERNAGRCEALAANCRRMGAHWVEVRCEDAAQLHRRQRGRLRPRAARPALLRPRHAAGEARRALAQGPGPDQGARAPAGGPARGGRRPRAQRRIPRLLHLHDLDRARTRSACTLPRPPSRLRGRRPRRGAARVPPPAHTALPAADAARPRHRRLLHRPPAPDRGGTA